MHAKPFPQSFWVQPGLLCAGHYPGSIDADERDQKLLGLLDRGILRVLSLMEPNEKSHGGAPFVPYMPRLQELAAERSIALEWHSLPIPDKTPPSVELMREILARIDSWQQAGLPTYLHCWGGHGRTGTVVCCYLIERGHSPDAAVERLLQLRANLPKNQYPLEGDQPEFVRSWVTR